MNFFFNLYFILQSKKIVKNLKFLIAFLFLKYHSQSLSFKIYNLFPS